VLSDRPPGRLGIHATGPTPAFCLHESRETARATTPSKSIRRSPATSRASSHTNVYTLHLTGQEDLSRLYAAHHEVPYVAISQRPARPRIPVAPREPSSTHGLDPEGYPPTRRDDGFVLHLGRFAPEKGSTSPSKRHSRREFRSSWPAAFTEKADDQTYFQSEVWRRSSISGRDRRRRSRLSAQARPLAAARALLCPIRWEEPFGLVAIEAMLVGRRSSVLPVRFPKSSTTA